MSRLEEIKRKLSELAASDPDLKAFGADTHKYALNPCLTEAQVAAIEQQHNFKVPDDYRHFIIELGNGGAGPYYGLKPLEKAFPWLGMEQNPGLVSKPFALTEPTFALQGCVGSSNLDEYFRRIETDERYYNKIMRCVNQYNKPKYSHGLILLSDYGDGILFTLPVNGPETGNVWVDDMVDQAGIFPVASELTPNTRTTFLDWYENWLDQSLAKAKGEIPNESGTYMEYANNTTTT